MRKGPGRERARDLADWRRALVVAFFATGLGMATWVSRTPAIRDAIGASTGEMGLVIAGLSVGSVVGIAAGGRFVVRRGARFVVVLGMAAIVLGLLVAALGVVVGEGVLVAAGLACFGYGMGSGEIGLNVGGVELEIAVGRSVVPGLHGWYSLGVFAGGLAGLGANSAGVPVFAHLAAVALLAATGSRWLVARLPPLTVPAPADEPAPGVAGTDGGGRAWLDGRLLGLGVIILGMALAEGSANDWLPLIVVDGFGRSAALGSVVYALFGLSMAVGRLSGGAAIDRFGRAPVIRAGALTAAAGIGLVAVAPDLVWGVAGTLLWGLGASLGFPVVLSAAGDDPVHAARRATAVASAGYAAFLAGPPVLGFLAEEVGLRDAILVVLAAVLATVPCSGAVRPPGRPASRHAPPPAGPGAVPEAGPPPTADGRRP
ncbi:MFS transporter [Streptomyces fructofermentans]|uniref:MFS transporter n=1 Tax=Streptomyces fructofermentans TaxID=152141 RepID=UPI001E62FFE7|nr:MFS transporter [Streptomyces fructofermentans]